MHFCWCLCRRDGLLLEPLTDIFSDLSEVCACFTEQKKHFVLVIVHYSPLVHVTSLPTCRQLHGDRALEVKCVSLPCFVLVYLLNVQQSFIPAFLMS